MIHDLVMGTIVFGLIYAALFGVFNGIGSGGEVVTTEGGQLSLTAPGPFGARWGVMTPVGLLLWPRRVRCGRGLRLWSPGMKLFGKSGAGGKQAVVGDTVIAESADTVRLEGNHYFPPDSVDWDLLFPSTQTSVCPWKGVASYYDVVVDGRTLAGAAWVYEDPTPAAQGVKGYLAFWRGVSVRSVD